MLWLGRHVGERIRLMLPDGQFVWIEVIDIQGRHKTRLGITAPVGVVIEREEIIRDAANVPGERPTG